MIWNRPTAFFGKHSQAKQKSKRDFSYLRRKSLSSHFAWQPVAIRLFRFLSNLGLLLKSSKLSNQMCKNYGHSVSGQKWERGRIYCCDCGERVTDSLQLRKSCLG